MKNIPHLFFPLVLAALFFLGCGNPKTQEPKNLLFILVDTLRADHLSCYGYEKIRTENLDLLAQEGIRYSRAVSAAPWTCPSMASIFTSLYPDAHGMVLHPIRDAKSFRALSPGLTTLAEALQEKNYQTHALSEQVWCSPSFGFSQGFDTFELLDDRTRVLTERAIEKLKDTSRDRPFFLYLHYLDPHTPYTPPDEFCIPHPGAGRFGLESLDWDGWWQRLWNIDRNTPDVEEFLDYVISLYDGEILFVDHAIGRILETLQEQGLADNTLVAVVADHGEAFLEHAMLHGSTLFTEEVHVPMLIKIPWEPRLEGVTVEEAVSTVDLMPTLLSALGALPPPGIQGKTRLPGAASANLGQGDRENYVFSENAYNLALERIQSNRHSLIFNRRTGESFFFDLQNDPMEQRDALAEQPERFQPLWDRLMARLKEAETWHRPQGPRIDLSGEMEDRLRGLGYLK